METLIVHPKNKKQFDALKMVMSAMEVDFEVKKQKDEFFEGLKESINQVKLHKQGKIILKSAKEILDEL